MEYKIGDVVKIKSAEEIYKTDISIGWCDEMYAFCEKVVKIKEIERYRGSSGRIYTIYHFEDVPETMSQWLWTSDMFYPYCNLPEPKEAEVMNLLL